MVSESSSEKNMKLPTFDGDYKKFQMWWTRFEVFSIYYDFKEALTGEDDKIIPSSDKEEIDATTKDGKVKEEAKKRNQRAMMYLTMAFTSETVMGMVYKSRTAAWPGGLARSVCYVANEKYRPIDTDLSC
jgi:hypothetical protein